VTSDEKALRTIAFYLPQFHPIQENDAWWGPGFTEWRNVVQARPRFKGHYQPHLPADLGFYDLRLGETRSAQAALAERYGVTGFCYYHYWFHGRRLLERPFAEVLASGEPDFPFCLCWANEDWTKSWDGRSTDVLVPQTYDLEDHRAHVRALLPAFEDERYIRVDGRPVFVVYRAHRIPDVKAATDVWREEASRAGVGDLFLCRVESFHDERDDPRGLGFDAAIEFQPDWIHLPDKDIGQVARRWYQLRHIVGHPADRVHPYEAVVELALSKEEPDYLRFPCVTPMWDNSARRERDAVILDGATPDAFGRWDTAAARR